MMLIRKIIYFQSKVGQINGVLPEGFSLALELDTQQYDDLLIELLGLPYSTPNQAIDENGDIRVHGVRIIRKKTARRAPLCPAHQGE